jgi:hypothetical protein
MTLSTPLCVECSIGVTLRHASQAVIYVAERLSRKAANEVRLSFNGLSDATSRDERHFLDPRRIFFFFIFFNALNLVGGYVHHTTVCTST